MTNIEKLIATAKSQIGYLEKASNSQLDDFTANAGSNNYTKYARDLDALGVYNGNKNGYAWCDMFADWCFYATFGLDMMVALLCQPLGGLGAGCTYSAQYFKNNGQFYTTPQAGDQIFFTNDGGSTSNHTGLVYKVDGTTVYTIEGNTSSDAGVVANGGAVAAKSYSLTYSKIMGYGRPNWSLVPEEEEEVTQEQFEAMWATMRQGLQDNDSETWSQEARDWAIANGLVNGNGDTVNGEANMMWEDLLTREQFVTVLYRFAQLMGKV